MNGSRMRMRLDYDGPRTRGIELLELLLTTGDTYDGDLAPQDAEDALGGLELLEFPWLVHGMVEGGEQFASQVHAKMGRGLQEVVQNAQDQAARNLRFGWRKREGRAELLIAHDGAPVALHDVVFMAYPLVSGSRRDPDRIGRFGIGLKTLNQLGDRLAVHCPPFDFEIHEGRVRRTKPPRAMRGFWDPKRRETLFILRLADGFDLRFFRSWFQDWDVESLVFLRQLRRLSLINLNTKSSVLDYRLNETRKDVVELGIPGGDQAERVFLRDAKSGRQWARYTIRYPTPRKLRELKGTDKPFGDHLTLALAIPQRGERPGRLYAGLPLSEPCSLPFSLHAPFFVNVDRTSLRDDKHGANNWLIDRLGELIAAVALQRFEERPSAGWRCVPLDDEQIGEPGGVLHQRGEASLERARTRVKSRLRFRLHDGAEVRVDDLVYEAPEVDGLLTDQDQEAHRWGKRALPTRFRDGGRWREVLVSLGAWSEVSVSEALEMLEWDEPDFAAARGTNWIVRLAAAALKAGESENLLESRCLALTNGHRVSPSDVMAEGLLLVHRPEKKGLAADLDVAIPIARAYLASTKEAKRVRAWLHERSILKSHATDLDAVRALARGDGERPVDLSRADRIVLKLRDTLETLPAEDRDNLSAGIGRNIMLAGSAYDARKQRELAPVIPAHAYLPTAIDKNEGWSTAAAQTPGIQWIHRKYATILKSRRETRIPGALAFLRRLGSEVAPRLEPDANQSLYAASLPAHQRDELRGLGRADVLLDDWISPDLDLVLADLLKERKANVRRKRARALFLAINRSWTEYVDRASAVPGYYHYRWHRRDPISATWLARLASTPWLTTQEKGLHPKAPRDLRILTGAAHGFRGEDPAHYAEELDEEHADTPLAHALGIRGRPPASELLDLLDELREAEANGTPIDQRRVQRCYEELARYCPAGADQDKADVSPREIKAAFGYSTSAKGLVRHEGRWLTPSQARRGEPLDARLATVRGAPQLWKLLNVQETDLTDCVEVLRLIANDGVEARPSQIRIYRRMLELLDTERQISKKLAGVPFFTFSGWVRDGLVHASPNPALAQALAGKLPVWKPPLALEELGPLVSRLPVQVIEDQFAKPSVDTAALVAGAPLTQDMPNAVEHLKNTLIVYNTSLYDRIPREDWSTLGGAQVALGTSWAVKIQFPGRRGIRVNPAAFLFADPPLLCALDEEEAADMRTGGQAIASFFNGAGLSESDRAFIAMSWERAFRLRQDVEEALDVDDEVEESGDVEPQPGPTRRKRLGRRRRRPMTKEGPEGGDQEPAAERELIDPKDVNLHALAVTVVEARGRGKLLATKRRPLKEPDPRRPRRRPGRGGKSSRKPHDPQERERVGFELVDDYLHAAYGLKLKDYRDRKDIGADGVDHDEDVWVELKAHAGEAPESVKLTASEAERASKKRDRYWLVVASGLEKGFTPRLLIIPNPITRLNAYLGGGIRLVVKK